VGTQSTIPGAYQYPPGSGNYYTGGLLTMATSGTVMFAQVPAAGTTQGVDFSMGGLPANQWLVQPGDYLEIRDGGVYLINAVTGPNTLQLSGSAYDLALQIPPTGTTGYVGTTNYRILRQPRILIGEEPLSFPNNFAANFNTIPGTTTAGSNVAAGPSGFPEILFSPTGAVVGTNAGSGMLFITVYDQTMNPFDLNRTGIVAVQTRTGFIGAYAAASTANPFYFAQIARESGL
jgi:hypothetical protein